MSRLSFLLLSLICWSISAAFQSKRAVTARKTTRSSSSSSSSARRTQSKPIDVLCVGDALFDCIANDDARGLTVEEMVARDAWTPFPGGAPANVATACCKLGTPSAFCGCLGSDANGEELLSLLRDEIGVDVTMVQRDPKAPTRRVMVTRSAKGDREFGGFFQGLPADAFSDCFLDANKLLMNCDVVKEAKWLTCSTLSLAFEASSAAVRALVKQALKKGDCQLLVDVNWRTVFWKDEDLARKEIMDFVQQANVVKLTDEEAEWLLDIPPEDALSDPGKVHACFPNAFAVLVTAGEKGAAYSINRFSGKVEPFVVDVTETTGAGDAFTAGFLHGILQNGEPTSREEAHQMITFAAAVGALTCTREGAIAAQPTFHEVESFLIHGEQVWK